MRFCFRAPLWLELVVAAGLLLIVSACFPQKRQSLPADTVIQIGPAGTPRLVKGGHLAAELESTAAYTSARQKGDYGEMALIFLLRQTDLFKLATPRQDLLLLASQADGLGHHHAKFQQVVEGIPVWHKTLSVHFDPNDRLYRVDGDYLPTPLAVDTRPILSDAEARAKAVAGIAGSGDAWKVQASELIVYADTKASRLAYRITVAKGLTGREDRILSADTGRLLKRLTRINP
jgi:Zn-dependent metalloprotease